MTIANHYENSTTKRDENETSVTYFLLLAAKATKIGVDYVVPKNRIPSFFQPFVSFSDAAQTLASPVYAPFALACAVALTGVITALMAATCIASFTAAGALAMFESHEYSGTAANIGCASFILAAIGALVMIPVLTLSAVVSLPLALIYSVTRSTSSIFSGVNKLFEKNKPLSTEEKPLEESEKNIDQITSPSPMSFASK